MDVRREMTGVRRTRCRSLQRHGRGAILWGLAGFVLLQIGLRVLIDFPYPVLRDPRFETKARQLEDLVRRAPGHPFTVITLGSSVTYHAYHAKLLEEVLAAEGGRPCVVYNMAEGGAGPLTHLLFVQRLLEKGIRPRPRAR